MTSLASRAAILVFARIANYLVILLSPIFLVRMLDIGSYGVYREFVLYALLLVTLFGFSANGNLLFFIPKNPVNERKYVTNTVIFIFIATIVGSIVVIFFWGSIASETSIESVSCLLYYVFFFVNLDVLETYWLAKKRSDYVLVYSTVRAVVRMSAIIIAAYMTRDVGKIILVMVLVEVAKSLIIFMWMLKENIFDLNLDVNLIREQLKYVLPLGAAGQVYNLNQKVGSLFVSMKLGPEALAIYTIGMYQVPVISIIRSAVSDVIFPDVVKHANSENNDARLDLWKRANVLFCFFVFPVFLIFFINARLFIEVLFTDSYSDAAAVFQVMLLLMLRQCFEMGVPLRAKNKNRYFISGNILALALNLSVLVFSYKVFGLIGPAVALLLSDLFLAVYMGRGVLGLYSIKLRDLLLWGDVGRLIFAAVAPLPVLILGESILDCKVCSAMLSSAIYVGLYWWIVRRLNLKDVDFLLLKFKGRLRVSR